MADYAGVLDDLRAQRSTLQQEVADLDTAIAAIERLMSRRPEQPVTAAFGGTGNAHGTNVPPAKETFVGPTMPTTLERYFQVMDNPQLTTRQVVDAMRLAGLKDAGHLRGHVYNTLDRLSKEGAVSARGSDNRWSLRESNKAVAPDIFSGESAH